MYSLSGKQLLTCRYWAFGSGCPDVDNQGVQTCPYAHWDTGRLADFYEQRGTCFEWFHKRVCPFGYSCAYEHRDTGLMGLNQGMLVLHGLNLEIANAANRSGFNTRNQVALMDLIWAVRRIAFRHAVERPKIQRPPKHPIYPDRYRPGDPSDNMKKRRKRRREASTSHPNTGTSDNPIYLDDDVEAVQNGSTAKRQKVEVGQIGSHIVELPSKPRPLNPAHPSKFQSSSDTRQDRGRPKGKDTIYMPSPKSLNLPPPRPPSIGPIFNNNRPLINTEPRDTTIHQLRKVSNTFKDNIDAIIECGNVMKTLYNSDDRLADNLVFKELEVLKARFDGCGLESENGMATVQRIIALLDERKENVNVATLVVR